MDISGRAWIYSRHRNYRRSGIYRAVHNSNQILDMGVKMSDMKCPFCGKKLWYDEQNDIYRCMKSGCVMDYEGGTEQLWQELIRTRKALDVAVDALKSAKTRLELINNSKFANLNNVLQIQSQCEVLKINKALEQITAEQKD